MAGAWGCELAVPLWLALAVWRFGLGDNVISKFVLSRTNRQSVGRAKIALHTSVCSPQTVAQAGTRPDGSRGGKGAWRANLCHAALPLPASEALPSQLMACRYSEFPFVP